MGIIFGVIVLIIGIASGIFFFANKRGAYGTLSIVAGVLICGIMSASSFFTIVDTGHTGIPVTFGKVGDTTLDAGFHFKGPFTSVVQMDNRVQKCTIEYDCFSSDIQDVLCTYTVNYQISKANAQDIYRTLGKDYAGKVMAPNISEAVKTVIAKYNAESLISKREIMSKEIETILKDSLVQYNIELVSTALENLEFNKGFTDAVEAKQIAIQDKLRATTEQEQRTMEAEQAAERDKIKAAADAEIAKIKAEADLEVQKINADAAEYVGQKEAAKNTAIAKSLTPELVSYFMIDKWNGMYPTTYMGSENVSTLLDIGAKD